MRTRSLLAILIVAVASAGCMGAPAGPLPKLRVGVLLPRATGPAPGAAAVGRGVTLAAADLRTEKIVDVELVSKEDNGTADGATAAFQSWSADASVGAVIGGLADHTANALSVSGARHSLVVIAPGSSGTILKSGHYFFRTSLPGTLQGEALARYAMRSGWKRVTIVYDGGSHGSGVASEDNYYGESIRISFAESLRGQGGEVANHRVFRNGERRFARFVRGVRSEDPQAVLFAGEPDEGKAFLDELRAAGLRTPVMAPDIFAAPDVVRTLGAAAEDLVVAGTFHPDVAVPAVRAFVQRFRNEHQTEPDQFAARGYDAMKVIGLAIKKARRAVFPDGVRVDRARLRDAIADTRDYQGATGTLSADNWGNLCRGVVILKVRDGQLQTAP